MKEETPIIITSGTIIKTIIIGILFYLAYLLKDIVLVVLTSIMIASCFEPIIKSLMSFRFSFNGFGKQINRQFVLPRLVGVIIVYLGISLIFGGLFYFFLPTLISDTVLLSSSLPNYVRTADLWNPLNGGGVTLPGISLKEVAGSLNDTLNDAGIFTTVSGFFGGIVSFVLIVVLSFYLSVQDDGVGNFLKIVVPLRYEAYVLDLWRRSATKIGLWMQGQLLLGVLIGVLTYLGLSILGVRNALFLALIASIFELIPVVGIVLATIPAVAVALTDGGINLAILTLGLYILIQQFESNLIYPLVVKKIVGIPSIVVILTLIAGAKLAGFLGIILSVPIAAIIVEVIDDLEKHKLQHRG